jgi:chromosome segregation ATPase
VTQYYALTEDDTEAAIRRLRSDLQNDLGELRSDMESDIAELRRSFGSFTGEYSSLEQLHEELTGRIDDVEAQATRQSAVLERITGRLAWLERHAVTAGAVRSGLDKVPAPVRQLAARVETAYALEAQLLSEYQRTGLRHDVRRYAGSCQQLEAATSRALAASATLADTPVDDARHRAAATELTISRSARDQLATQLPELKAGATAAQQRLDADEARRDQYGPTIAARDTAWSTLRTCLRTSITAAIERDELLPSWFLNHLGPVPPREDQQLWWDTATEVLAYRVTYQVNDQHEPLGESPPATPSPRRHDWYRRLTADLANR